MSDHLPQFLFAPNVLSNPLCNKSSILERDWSKFNNENFILDYFNKTWSEIFQLDQHNADLSMDSYLDHMNAILDIHTPYKKVDENKLRFKIKLWVTPALQKSLTVKNHLLKKFINCNDSQTKEQLRTRYKKYRNLLSILLKRSKTNYYNHYFNINWNNIKNTWKEIRSILSIKPNPSDIPKILNTNDSNITNPVEIANVFNSYFSSIASQTKVNIKYSNKRFSDSLKNRARNSFFSSPIDKYEIALIISSLDSTKSVGPNSIPTEILKLLKNNNSCQIVDILNMSLTSGVFPSFQLTLPAIDQSQFYQILIKYWKN